MIPTALCTVNESVYCVHVSMVHVLVCLCIQCRSPLKANQACRFQGNRDQCEAEVVYTRGGWEQCHHHIPGNHVPGTHIPGNHIPGNHIPGNHVPGTHIPGNHIPGTPSLPPYQVEMLQEGFEDWQPIIQQPKNMFIVKALQSNTCYRFRVLACNEYGAGEPSDPSDMITTKGRSWLSGSPNVARKKGGNTVCVHVHVFEFHPRQSDYLGCAVLLALLFV